MMRMVVKLFSSLILAISVNTVMADAALDKIKESGVLNVALYKDFPPYSYVENGKQTGIDVEIAKALAEKLAVNVSIRMVGADETMSDDLRNNVWKGHYMGGGVADVMLHAPYDREYAKAEDMVAFVGPYQLEKLAFAINTDKVGTDPTVASFIEAPIGVEVDTLSDFYLLRAVNGKIAERLKHYKSNLEAITALKSGEIAAVMGPRGELEGLLAEAPQHLQIRELVTPGLSRGTWAMGAAVKARNEDLAKEVDKAMGALVKEGKIRDIFAKYKVAYNAPALPPIAAVEDDDNGKAPKP
ncbi:MAG: transporter substrate-binding domain-containing protein [Thiofilum sp.]|uniref:substrate-binding periplasmic protein n=1 Tax=Thiofilum sp. TaxID=2212733 RepID=UPI0025F0BE37|nr:transporter substrate-binding domain-containing protein [Thiofilum sp.]